MIGVRFFTQLKFLLLELREKALNRDRTFSLKKMITS